MIKDNKLIFFSIILFLLFLLFLFLTKKIPKQFQIYLDKSFSNYYKTYYSNFQNLNNNDRKDNRLYFITHNSHGRLFPILGERKNFEYYNTFDHYHWGFERLLKTYKINSDYTFRLNYYSNIFLLKNKISINKVCKYYKENVKIINNETFQTNNIINFQSNYFPDYPLILRLKIPLKNNDKFISMVISNENNELVSYLLIENTSKNVNSGYADFIENVFLNYDPNISIIDARYSDNDKYLLLDLFIVERKNIILDNIYTFNDQSFINLLRTNKFDYNFSKQSILNFINMQENNHFDMKKIYVGEYFSKSISCESKFFSKHKN
jgi:hypothetical protein